MTILVTACVVTMYTAAWVSAQTTQPVASTPPMASPTTVPAAPAPAGAYERKPIARSTAAPVRKDSAATKPPVPSTGMDTVRVMAALALVVVVIFLLRWIAQQFFGMTPAKKSSRAVQVLSRSMISPKQQVLLLQVGRRVIVVGDTGGQMSSLCEITDPDEIALLAGQLQEDKAVPVARAFGTLFGRAQKTFSPEDEPTKSSVDAEPEPDVDPTLTTTRAELSGLMEKVRGVASGMNRGRS